MRDRKKSSVKSIEKENNNSHYQAMPGQNAYKTNETILDGGNIEDYNGPLSETDSPVLEKNIADDNLSHSNKERQH